MVDLDKACSVERRLSDLCGLSLTCSRIRSLLSSVRIDIGLWLLWLWSDTSPAFLSLSTAFRNCQIAGTSFFYTCITSATRGGRLSKTDFYGKVQPSQQTFPSSSALPSSCHTNCMTYLMTSYKEN